MAEYVRIEDPDKPGDYLVLAKDDFNPKKHKLFEEQEESSSPPETEESARPGRRRGR